MEALPTHEAAARLSEQLGETVNVQKFHRLAAKYGIRATIAAPGLRGAKFWDPEDVDDIARRETTAA